jgi:hypothetical protein
VRKSVHVRDAEFLLQVLGNLAAEPIMERNVSHGRLGTASTRTGVSGSLLGNAVVALHVGRLLHIAGLASRCFALLPEWLRLRGTGCRCSGIEYYRTIFC